MSSKDPRPASKSAKTGPSSTKVRVTTRVSNTTKDQVGSTATNRTNRPTSRPLTRKPSSRLSTTTGKDATKTSKPAVSKAKLTGNPTKV